MNVICLKLPRWLVTNKPMTAFYEVNLSWLRNEVFHWAVAPLAGIMTRRIFNLHKTKQRISFSLSNDP
jgi:hypothetical protein